MAAVLQSRIRNPAKRFWGIHHFKDGMPEDEYFSSYRKIFPHKTSLQDYHGPAFPKSANQIFATKTPKEPANAVRECFWALARALIYTQEIKDFLITRKAFEDAILKNDFDAACAALDTVERTWGKSIWLYQNRVASAYISQRESAPAEMARSVVDEVRENNRLHLLLHFVIKRTEGANLRDKIRSDLLERISHPIYKAYYQAKIFDITSSAEAAVSSRLFIDSQASLIDHYDSLVQCLQAATSDDMFPAELKKHILNSVSRLYRETKDVRLLGVVSMLGGISTDAIASEGCSNRAKAIESYTSGQYVRSIEVARNLLEKDQSDSAMRILYIKACVAAGERPHASVGICGELNENLFNVISAGEDFFRCAHALFIMADRFFDHAWMLYLRVAVMYEVTAELDKPIQDWMRDVYARDSYVTPFTVLCMEKSDRDALIFDLKSTNLYPVTLALVEDAIGTKCAQHLDARVARYRARELLAQQRYEEAAELYSRVSNEEIRAAVKLRCAGGAALALMRDGKYLAAVNTVVGAYIESPHAPTLLPLQRLVDCLPDIDSWPNTIRLGILLNMAQQVNEDEVDMSVPRLAFERFCTENDIYSPATLLERLEEFGRDFVINYLGNVWRPEVMRQTLIYSSEDEIEEARIEACKILAQIDTERSKVHQEELASRIKQQEIAKTTALVEKSRVYVDIESIKRALKGRLKNSYAQYKGAIGLHGKPQDDVLRKFEAALSGMDAMVSLPVLLSSVHLVDFEETPTQAEIQFSVIFGEISKEFLTGDHGLNAYLSTRVRHGKFVDALRKAVMDEHLVTAKTADGAYALNMHWMNRLSVEVSECVLGELERFSSSFDEKLSHTRDTKIQIQSFYEFRPPHSNDDALFKYYFSMLERKLFQRYDADFKDLDELIVRCVDALWEKTDNNLQVVRKYLDQTLRSQLMSSFNELDAALSSFPSDWSMGGLQNAIARARTATQQALDNVIGWFRRSEVYDRQDFDIDIPPQIAAAMVNRTMSMQSPWPGPDCHVESADAKLPGRTLDTMVDIFYELFENAVKHSQAARIPLEVEIRLAYCDGEFHGEVVSGAQMPTQEQLDHLTHLRESLATVESRRLAQGEGRSGFRKIYIALDNSIYKSSNLRFAHEEAKFKVKFSFKMAESQ